MDHVSHHGAPSVFRRALRSCVPADPAFSDESGLAERVLRTALLSAVGAEFALGPLVGLAEPFAGASRSVRRRPVASRPTVL